MRPRSGSRYARRLADDLREGRHARRVAEDAASGDRSGVAGTPTFFINGRRHHGAYDLATLTAAVRLALAVGSTGQSSNRR